MTAGGGASAQAKGPLQHGVVCPFPSPPASSSSSSTSSRVPSHIPSLPSDEPPGVTTTTPSLFMFKRHKDHHRSPGIAHADLTLRCRYQSASTDAAHAASKLGSGAGMGAVSYAKGGVRYEKPKGYWVSLRALRSERGKYVPMTNTHACAVRNTTSSGGSGSNGGIAAGAKGAGAGAGTDDVWCGQQWVEGEVFQTTVHIPLPPTDSDRGSDDDDDYQSPKPSPSNSFYYYLLATPGEVHAAEISHTGVVSGSSSSSSSADVATSRSRQLPLQCEVHATGGLLLPALPLPISVKHKRFFTAQLREN